MRSCARPMPPAVCIPSRLADLAAVYPVAKPRLAYYPISACRLGLVEAGVGRSDELLGGLDPLAERGHAEAHGAADHGAAEIDRRRLGDRADLLGGDAGAGERHLREQHRELFAADARED